MELSKYLKSFKDEIYDGFANAIEIIPLTLIKNSNFNKSIINKWRNLNKMEYLDIFSYPPEFKSDLKIWDSTRVKLQQIVSGVETINVLLKIDCITQSIIPNQTPKNIDVTEEMEENKNKWGEYNRFQPKFDEGQGKWTKEEKIKFKKREEKFYSEEKVKERKKIEEYSNKYSNN
jgi:hypothetical protein